MGGGDRHLVKWAENSLQSVPYRSYFSLLHGTRSLMSRRSQFLAPLRNLFQGPTPFDNTPARNKRRRQANKPVPFSMQVSPLSMELLEPRMLLTVFYD